MNNLIKSSLEYYDLKFNKLLKNLNVDINNKIRKNEINSDLGENIFTINDKNNNNKFKSKYEILCKIDEDNKLLTWSWALSNINKNNIYLSKSLLNYGLDLNDKSLLELKTMLINSKLNYNNELSLIMILKISLFLTKADGFYYDNNYSNDVYIFYDIKN